MASLKLVGVLFLVVLGLVLAGCGGDDEEAAGGPNTTFVGEIPDSDFFVAIALTDTDDVLAYACDGASVGEWFRGQVSEGRLELTSTSGDATLEAELTNEQASGTVTVGGETLDFTADPALGAAGLYRADGEIRGEKYLSGWVVLPDGRQKGVTALGRSAFAAPTLTLAPNRRTISPS